jgi:hypothetical protein
MRQRPISVMVFGILNVGFALWKIFTALLSAVLHPKALSNSVFASMTSDPGFQSWSHFSVGVEVVFAIILIASGVGLLLMQNWARVLSIIYSILEIIMVLAGLIVNHRLISHAMTTPLHGVPPGLIAAFVVFALVVVVAVSLAYPILLLIFMTRPKIIEALTGPSAPEAC